MKVECERTGIIRPNAKSALFFEVQDQQKIATARYRRSGIRDQRIQPITDHGIGACYTDTRQRGGAQELSPAATLIGKRALECQHIAVSAGSLDVEVMAWSRRC